MSQKLQTTLLLWVGLGFCLIGPSAAQAQAQRIISQYHEEVSNDKWIKNTQVTTWDSTDWETVSNITADRTAKGNNLCLNCFQNRRSQASPLVAGNERTFDIASWNLEWFGSPEKSGHATSFAQQLDAVSSKLLELNADVYALQEVIQTPSGNYLQQLVDKLNALTAPGTFSGVYGSRYSYYWASFDPAFPPQKVAYIYRNATVSVKSQRSFFSESYTGANSNYPAGYPGGKPSYFWASGRLPFELTIDASIQGTTQRLHLVNLHAKAMSDSRERRAFDGAVLFDSLRTAQYATKNIIVLGDFNDYLTGSTGGGTSPYAGWMTGGNAYFQPAATRDRSIDHVLISNELYNEFETGGKLSAIGSTDISDHDPLLVSLLLSNDKEETITGLEDLKATGVKIFPNPTQGQTTLQWDVSLGEQAQVRVLDASGRLRWKGRLQQGENLQTEGWAPGLYLLQLQWGKRSANGKLLVQ